MEDNRAEWEISLKLKATCGEEGERPGELDYRLTGGGDSESNGSLEVLAMSLAALLRAASWMLVPSSEDDVIESFARKIRSIHWLTTERKSDEQRPTN